VRQFYFAYGAKISRQQHIYASKNNTVFNELFSVKLVGDQQDRGRLEVFHDGVWGTVCGDFFSDAAARVVCNMLGFG